MGEQSRIETHRTIIASDVPPYFRRVNTGTATHQKRLLSPSAFCNRLFFISIAVAKRVLPAPLQIKSSLFRFPDPFQIQLLLKHLKHLKQLKQA